MVDSSGMETLLWAGAMYDRTNREEGRRSVIGENYSACGKIFSRLMLGQRIEPVSAGKRVKHSNANENKQLISPSIAENAVCAANFAPFLHFF